jgi:hypothetical protein
VADRDEEGLLGVAVAMDVLVGSALRVEPWSALPTASADRDDVGPPAPPEDEVRTMMAARATSEMNATQPRSKRAVRGDGVGGVNIGGTRHRGEASSG